MFVREKSPVHIYDLMVYWPDIPLEPNRHITMVARDVADAISKSKDIALCAILTEDATLPHPSVRSVELVASADYS